MDRDDPVLTVLGELVVDLLPVPDADAGPQGTAPQYVARPGGNALNVAVAAGRLEVPVHLLARLRAAPLAPHLRRPADPPGGAVTRSPPPARPGPEEPRGGEQERSRSSPVQ